jgi:ADP-ribose pyrophosphatase YjhB (NUDIX family)
MEQEAGGEVLRVSILEAASPVLQRIWKRMPVPVRERLLLLTQATYTVGVSGVVLDDAGRVLLLRNRFRYSRSWQLPGEFLTRGETLDGALAREIEEEAGLEVRVERQIVARVARPQHLDVCYVCRVIGGKLRLDSSEILEGRFFEVTDLPAEMPAEQRKLLEDLSTKDALRK